MSRLPASALILLICAAPLFAADAPADVARRFVTLAYENQFDALPKSSTANTQQFERHAKNILRVRVIRVESLTVRDVTADADTATALLDVSIRKTERPETGNWTAQDAFPLRVKLARENGVWLVSTIEFPNAELAQKLLDLGDEERAKLIEQHASKNLARAAFDRAMALLNLGKFAEAGRIAAIARDIAVRAADRGGEALAIGVAAFTGKDDAEKKRAAIESLEIAKTLGDPDVLARAWYNRGRVVTAATGSVRGVIFPEQIEAYKTAWTFAERAEDPLIFIRTVYSLANIAASHSDYVNARRYVDIVLPVAREVGDTIGETTLENVLATVYFEQGDHELGMYHHTRALQRAEKDRSFAYTTLLLRKAIILADEGNLAEARAIFDKVLVRGADGVLRATAPTPGGHIATAMIHLAEIEADQGNFAQAECLLREAGMLHKNDGAVFLYELARHYADRDDPLGTLRFALPSLFLETLYREEKMTALFALARAYHVLGDHDRALATIVETIELRESVNAGVAGGEVQRARIAEQSMLFYRLAAQIELDRGRPAEALAYLERGRASVLTEILENGRAGAMAALDDANEAERQRRERELVRLSVERDRARAAGDEASVQMWSERLQEARAEHTIFLDGLRARSERRLGSRRFIDGSGLLARMKDLPPGLAAVEYLINPQHLDIFVARADASGARRVLHRRVNVPREDIEKRATQFVDQLARRDVNVQPAARELYDILIKPIEHDLAGAGTLLLVPDDALWRVPFAALADARGRFVVERWASVYAPSITAFAMIAKSKQNAQPRPATLFAVGNPKLDLASKEAVTSFYRDAELNPLPDAEREVDNLLALYDREHATVLKREQATETRTKKAVSEATVVHFATHALFDDANPMYSRLALARENASDDGWLESWEVAQLDLDADIVVLSACETARGHISSGGDGVVGMTWSFFIAGAHSTVATQWRVASNTTADLMVAFHRSLRARGGSPRDSSVAKAQALRNAQLRLLREGRSRHPYYWAPFVLFGS